MSIDYDTPPGMGKGLEPRDFMAHPVGEMFAPFPFPAMANSEIDDRLEVMATNKATLVDLRNIGMNGQPIPSTNQGSRGYCWAHSTVSCMLLLRAKAGLPYVELSAYAIACQIKNFRDQGGWNGESMKWVEEHGCPTSQTWPIRSVDRANVNSAMVAESLENRVTEWWDGGDDPKLFWTAVALGFPIASDYNDWGHSVCFAFGSRKNNTGIIWNSWGDQWKNNGMGPPQARSPVPNNWLCPRVTTA